MGSIASPPWYLAYDLVAWIDSMPLPLMLNKKRGNADLLASLPTDLFVSGRVARGSEPEYVSGVEQPVEV